MPTTPVPPQADRPRPPVIVIGAGPVGLCAAIDCARRGIATIVLEAGDTVSDGSRAICWARRTLEIFDRLGVAGPMRERGVTWRSGRVFLDETELYDFELAPGEPAKQPPFINLQQSQVEQILIDHARTIDCLDMRFRNRVTGLEASGDQVTVAVEGAAGPYSLAGDYVIAADGAHSTIRRLLGLALEGRGFRDRFLIVDVHMKAPFPTQRWFWFDPPFNRGRSALLHRQADDIWRIDLQIGRDADPEAALEPAEIERRLRAMLGDEARFTPVWSSVYTFQCRRLERFRHGRVLFAGDSAHLVSPFGARGANGGIQDVDNLVWKLALVRDGRAPVALLDSYDAERVPAADENIGHSTRATDFISPDTAVAQAFRDATLALARNWPFARDLVNSGRLSTPARYGGSPLNAPDDGAAGVPVGTACPDGPVRDDAGDGWLSERLGDGFCLLALPGTGGTVPRATVPTLTVLPQGSDESAGGAEDSTGALYRRFGDGMVYLIRPDRHVAARWRNPDARAIAEALARATGQQTGTERWQENFAAS